MRRTFLTLALMVLSVPMLNAAERKFSFNSAKEGQGVSLEVIDRFTVRLTVARPDYSIAPTVIRLTQPIAMDRPDVYRFAGETAVEGGRLRVRGRLVTNGTANEADDLAFVTWIFTSSAGRDSGGDDADEEVMEPEDP